VQRLREAARRLFDAEVAAWELRRARKQTGDDKWLAQVLRAGTLSDRVAALTLQVQESPPHRLAALDKLVDMAAQKDRRAAQLSLEALQDLFCSVLLPDGRRLARFEARGPRQLGEALRWAERDPTGVGKALVLWHFEDEVR
ncbi:unnamed protein product, partial [Phaeothamnion confervicola]